MEQDKLVKEYPTAYHPNDPAAEQLERLVSHFEDVAQSWSKVVYPALFAFILLAIYGFYLIFSLTTDVRKVADNMRVITSSFGTAESHDNEGSHMSQMADAVDSMSEDMEDMRFSVKDLSEQVVVMSKDVKAVSENVGTMTVYIQEVNSNMATMTQQLANLTPMLQAMNRLDYSTQIMAGSTEYMGRQLGDINSDMDPAGFMSRFMPF